MSGKKSSEWEKKGFAPHDESYASLFQTYYEQYMKSAMNNLFTYNTTNTTTPYTYTFTTNTTNANFTITNTTA